MDASSNKPRSCPPRVDPRKPAAEGPPICARPLTTGAEGARWGNSLMVRPPKRMSGCPLGWFRHLVVEVREQFVDGSDAGIVDFPASNLRKRRVGNARCDRDLTPTPFTGL